jgi:hypothetical protein
MRYSNVILVISPICRTLIKSGQYWMAASGRAIRQFTPDGSGVAQRSPRAGGMPCRSLPVGHAVGHIAPAAAKPIESRGTECRVNRPMAASFTEGAARPFTRDLYV